jgi:hypothetical protein
MPEGRASGKRRFLKILLLLLAAYAFWLAFQWLRYGRMPAASEAAEPREIVGVYHIHTRHSDGAAEPEAIARKAARQGLDFVIFTDHGNPNPAALSLRKRQGPVVVLAGSEISVNRGHLVALGFESPPQPFSSQAEEAALQVRRSGGFTVIAHPYSKVRWSWGEHAGYRGIEILSGDAMLRNNWARALPSLPLLPFAHRLPLLKLLTYPGHNLRRWDDLCRSHAVYAFFSCDAHLLYGPLLSLVHLHVLLPRPLPEDFREASALINEALREGRFYNCVAAAAPGHGFRFWGESGQAHVAMGSTARFTPDTLLHISVPEDVASSWSLLHNGEPVLTSEQKTQTYLPLRAGVYRVEVFLRERTYLSQDCPWILSNPIFLRNE